jgi:glycosyltransferase involved in cell wall biosynthesis
VRGAGDGRVEADEFLAGAEGTRSSPSDTSTVGDLVSESDGVSIGLVHDYLLVMRGAERTFAAMAECWPHAPIYTLLYDADGTEHQFAGRSVYASKLQRLRVRQQGFRRLMPFFPFAAERLPVGEHDVVLSSSSAFAHGVRAGPGAIHVCYCYTPFRYAWYEEPRALAEVPPPARPILRRTLAYIRQWDLSASQRVTHYLAISELSRQRIGDIYGRDATVVHPPVAIERFFVKEPEDYFLVVAEIVPHKQVGLALAAASRAGVPLKIVGEGPELPRLRRLYRHDAEFLGRLSDNALADVYARARALVIPNIEEFGITAVEAQAAGRPVVAADGGGVRETVVPGETGVLVPPGDVDALAEALRYTDFKAFDPTFVREHASDFSTESFKTKLVDELQRLCGGARSRLPKAAV